MVGTAGVEVAAEVEVALLDDVGGVEAFGDLDCVGVEEVYRWGLKLAFFSHSSVQGLKVCKMA